MTVHPADVLSRPPSSSATPDPDGTITTTAAEAQPGSEPAAVSTSAPRIAFLGNYGSENLGNEGSLEAVMASLRARYPAATFACICPNPARAELLHGVSGMLLTTPQFSGARLRWLDEQLHGLLRRLWSIVTATYVLRCFDVILVPGTGILDDFGERPGSMPFEIWRWSLAARLAGRPLSFLSIGAGPIRHKLSRRLMLWGARLAHARSYRDQQSKDYMQSIGLGTHRDRVLPDVAFLLPSPSLPAEPVTQAPGTAFERPTIVGLGVMKYSGWSPTDQHRHETYHNYAKRITEVAVAQIRRGRRVRLLVGEYADLHAARDVAGRIAAILGPEAAAVHAEPAADLHEVMKQMADVDVVVATRFHNVVCALKMAKPVVSLGYAGKNDVLMFEMGLPEFCRHVETFDPGWVSESIDAALERREEISRRLAVMTAAYRAELEAALPDLVDACLSRSAPPITPRVRSP